MRNEFALIDAIVEGLGDRATGDWVSVGPGDDAAVIKATPGLAQVASIDTLLPDVHFPAAAPAQLIGYRALMVSFSDLAAMRAAPRYCLVSLSMDESQGAAWVASLACGMADAARELGVYVCGGNLTRGPLNIAVSVHGEVEHQHLLRRSEGQPGQQLSVTGVLGAAAACVRTGQMLPVDPKALTPLQHAYYRPLARFDVAAMVQAASAGLDISDGLSQDLAHLCAASGCGAALQSLSIPIGAGATLEDALFGGDDYELLVASNEALPGAYTIGVLTAEPGLTLDGAPFAAKGFDHFGSDQ
jgi:thiamine-monophosphate kinase